MRDVLFLPSNNGKELVIATDCSGGIGEKMSDLVFAPDRIVAYFSMRVAMMELLAVGATPKAVILANFTGDQSWHDYISGINKVYDELKIESLPVVGSSETNMSLLHSALGLTIIGEIQELLKRIKKTPANAEFAIIGEPFVGEDVLKEKERVAPLSLFRNCLELAGIYELVPIGSKGILYELELLLTENGINDFDISSELDLHASSGPSTCFLISYQKTIEERLEKMAGKLFHKIKVYS
ncbi:ATPase [Schinkia sp. CFF1]